MKSEEICHHCGKARKVGEPDLCSTQIPSPHWFCCYGCKTIFEVIKARGWDAFYGFEERGDATAVDAQALAIDWESLRWQDFVQSEREGYSLSLYIGKIHCSACIWLIEKALLAAGANVVKVNLRRKRVFLTWRDASLLQLLRSLSEIGYVPMPLAFNLIAQEEEQERKALLLRTLLSWFAMMQVMMFAYPGYLGYEIDATAKTLLDFASLVMTLPVVFYCALPFLRNALLALRRGHITMDSTIAFGVLTAFVTSLFNQLLGAGPTYYDSITMFVALLLAARLIEGRLQRQAYSTAEQLARSLPLYSVVLPQYPQVEERKVLPTLALHGGMVVEVLAGELFAADGLVLEGSSAVEESIFSGEAKPVQKQPGDKVWAGSRNLAAKLVLRLSAAATQSQLSQMVMKVDEMRTRQREVIPALLNLIARYYLVVVCLLALVAGVWWWLTFDRDQALQVVIAMLVISCPCALSIALPSVRSALIARLSSLQLLTLRGDDLNVLEGVSDLVFDKTGTLSEGRFRLLGWQCLRQGVEKDAVVALVLAMEEGSNHPVALALAGRLVVGPTTVQLHSRQHFPSEGVEALWDGRTLRLGRADFVSALTGRQGGAVVGEGGLVAYEGEAAGGSGLTSQVYLGDGEGLIAVFAVVDSPREAALPTLLSLARLRPACRFHLLSGDSQVSRWQQWFSNNGVAIQVVGGLSPQQKLSYVERLREAGKVVMAVGDGVNDGEMLAAANVSAAMGAGTPVAQSAASLIILEDDLRRLPQLFELGRRAAGITRQNLVWAVAYNLLALPLAASGLATPLIAGLGMALSSLLVVLNASRLGRFQSRREG